MRVRPFCFLHPEWFTATGCGTGWCSRLHRPGGRRPPRRGPPTVDAAHTPHGSQHRHAGAAGVRQLADVLGRFQFLGGVGQRPEGKRFAAALQFQGRGGTGRGHPAAAAPRGGSAGAGRIPGVPDAVRCAALPHGSRIRRPCTGRGRFRPKDRSSGWAATGAAVWKVTPKQGSSGAPAAPW